MRFKKSMSILETPRSFSGSSSRTIRSTESRCSRLQGSRYLANLESGFSLWLSAPRPNSKALMLQRRLLPLLSSSLLLKNRVAVAVAVWRLSLGKDDTDRFVVELELELGLDILGKDCCCVARDLRIRPPVSLALLLILVLVLVWKILIPEHIVRADNVSFPPSPIVEKGDDDDTDGNDDDIETRRSIGFRFVANAIAAERSRNLALAHGNILASSQHTTLSMDVAAILWYVIVYEVTHTHTHTHDHNSKAK
mmetsp:Transcript_28453/g.66762  ORF Transcript_28453/g.66762 Transcript_28453/m.66762 type:complete len:252 (-) Transcript_28453:8-763(-)